jgi:hypothetical protein
MIARDSLSYPCLAMIQAYGVESGEGKRSVYVVGAYLNARLRRRPPPYHAGDYLRAVMQLSEELKGSDRSDALVTELERQLKASQKWELTWR